MAFSFSRNGVIVIVLDEENIERIQRNDPFEFDGAKMPGPISVALPIKLVIAYVPKADMPKVIALREQGIDALASWLFRGFEFTTTDETRGN